MAMNWKVVDERYLDYLREFERRIPRSNYGEDKYKPFFGVLFTIQGDISYITQISHPKSRHYKMKNQIDFKKVYDLKTNRLIGVVNLNYMFPIPNRCLQDLTPSNIGSHRTFNSESEKSKYIQLLRKQMTFINQSNIQRDAKRLYNEKITHPNSLVSNRCLDFTDLESRCKDFK